MENEQLEFNFETKTANIDDTYFASMREWLNSLESCYRTNNYTGMRESRHMLDLMLDGLSGFVTDKLYKKHHISTY